MDIFFNYRHEWGDDSCLSLQPLYSYCIHYIMYRYREREEETTILKCIKHSTMLMHTISMLKWLIAFTWHIAHLYLFFFYHSFMSTLPCICNCCLLKFLRVAQTVMCIFCFVLFCCLQCLTMANVLEYNTCMRCLCVYLFVCVFHKTNPNPRS